MSKISPINGNGYFINSVAKKQVKSNPCLSEQNSSIYPLNSIYFKNNKISSAYNNYITNPIICAQTSKSINSHTISFMGKKVHIIDGGNHATNMEHFAHAISSNMDTTIYEVETNSKDKNTKQLKSLEQQLKKLNESKTSFSGEYVAVPALASVPILNIQDQYNRIMGEDKKFTPENMKANKKQLLNFLEKIYNNPSYYSTYIGYMDSNKQGIQYTYGVIQEINNLIKKGAKVYVPSGHPQDETLKWMAAQRGLKPELYHYIATGEDIDHCVEKMHKEIKKDNWYNFNLLSLSDANIVGVKGAKGAQDYMFAAYDSCITDGARGVYNFSPVRKNDKVIGYSYTDTSTNEYPFEEFPANDQVANLVKFVGKPLYHVLATDEEIEELKECRRKSIPTTTCADKLYPISELYSEDDIKRYKLDLYGDYVDKSCKLFFRRNYEDKVIFPKCDCEGSGKPSVLSMWGSCFAVFNAIARDIKSENYCQNTSQISKHLEEMKYLKDNGTEYYNSGHSKQAEDFYNNAINIDKAFSLKNSNYFVDFEPYYLLGNLHYDNKHYEHAASCYNNAINILSSHLLNEIKIELPIVKTKYNNFNASKLNTQKYDDAIKKYEKKSLFMQLFTDLPKKPHDYNDYLNNYNNVIIYDKVMLLAQMYEKLSNICQIKNENYPAKVCKKAADDIRNCTQRGHKVLEYRSQGIQYIGDLYNEIKPD